MYKRLQSIAPDIFTSIGFSEFFIYLFKNKPHIINKKTKRLKDILEYEYKLYKLKEILNGKV